MEIKRKNAMKTKIDIRKILQERLLNKKKFKTFDEGLLHLGVKFKQKQD
jgi:hypothetical protein